MNLEIDRQDKGFIHVNEEISFYMLETSTRNVCDVDTLTGKTRFYIQQLAKGDRKCVKNQVLKIEQKLYLI